MLKTFEVKKDKFYYVRFNSEKDEGFIKYVISSKKLNVNELKKEEWEVSRFIKDNNLIKIKNNIEFNLQDAKEIEFDKCCYNVYNELNKITKDNLYIIEKFKIKSSNEFNISFLEHNIYTLLSKKIEVEEYNFITDDDIKIEQVFKSNEIIKFFKNVFNEIELYYYDDDTDILYSDLYCRNTDIEDYFKNDYKSYRKLFFEVNKDKIIYIFVYDYNINRDMFYYLNNYKNEDCELIVFKTI